jgi:protein phosphatase
MKPEEIQAVTLGDNYRLIAISDVHGNLLALQKLLKKVNYTSDDILVFVGDLFDKGPEELILDNLAYIRGLAKQENTYVVCGNWERVVWEYPKEKIVRWNVNNPFKIWAKEEGFDPLTLENFDQAMAAVKARHRDYVDWMYSLPLALETEDFVFVHAGLEPLPDWRDSDPQKVLRHDDFIYEKQTTGKWVVCGHIPAFSYPLSGMKCLPCINYETHVIAIDGGSSVISRCNQVNALIVEKNNGKLNFSADFADCFETCQVRHTVKRENVLRKKTDWRNIQLRIEQQGKHFSRCTLLNTNETIIIKNEHILWQNGVPVVYNGFCNLLSAEAGEMLSIADNSCSGYVLAKKQDGEIGWMKREALDI